MKKTLGLLLMCAALIPQTGLCVTEGVIEEAPPVEMEGAMRSTENPASKSLYLPDASYYAGGADAQPEWGASEAYVEPEFDGECFYPAFQGPGLSEGEIVRAQKLLEAYRSGEAAGDGGSVLEKTEDVIVGVYALNPEEFDGESVYVLLPNVNLTDEQILAVIDAYHQLGLEFDPSGLSYRNCARGGGIECSRFLSEEERARREQIAGQIRRGVLAAEQIDPEAGGWEQQLNLDVRYFNGLDSFSLRPYRPLSDEEIASALFRRGVHDETGEYDAGALERAARVVLTERLGCPISMECTQISRDGSYLPTTFDEQGRKGYGEPGRSMYAVFFSYRDAETGYPAYAHVQYDQERDTLITANFCIDYAGGMGLAEEGISAPSALTEAEYAAHAAAFAAERGIEETLSWERMDEIFLQGCRCERVRAQLSDGEWLTVYLDPVTGAVHGAEIEVDTIRALGMEEEINVTWFDGDGPNG